MKTKIVGLFVAILIFSSCDRNAAVKEYLSQQYPGQEVKIIKVTDTDSSYTCYNDLLERCTELNQKMSQWAEDTTAALALPSPEKSKRLNALLADINNSHIDSIAKALGDRINHPEAFPPNCRHQWVKAAIRDRVICLDCYYNANEEAIGHTSKEVLYNFNQFINLYSQAEKIKRVTMSMLNDLPAKVGKK